MFQLCQLLALCLEEAANFFCFHFSYNVVTTEYLECAALCNDQESWLKLELNIPFPVLCNWLEMSSEEESHALLLFALTVLTSNLLPVILIEAGKGKRGKNNRSTIFWLTGFMFSGLGR